MVAQPQFMAPFDEITDFLLSSPTPEQIIAFRPSATLQMRVSTLLQKNREGRLSEQEAGELNDYSQVNHLMILIKARARQRLETQPSTP